MSPQLIFVTGATGFLGSHVVDQLLEKGYSIRAAARHKRVEEARASYKKFGSRFEVVEIPDVATSDFGDAFKGVDALIHVASPLPFRVKGADLIKGAVEGSLNVLRQAEKAGVKKIIVTSSMVALFNPNNSFTDQDWNPVTTEQALAGDNFLAYIASKTAAERAVWEFAESHPHIDFTTICPPWMYGPFSPVFAPSAPDYGSLTTNIEIYRLLTPDGPLLDSAGYNDIRDIATLHVLALKAGPDTKRRKRFPVSSPYAFQYHDAVDYIAEKFPELKDRLAWKAQKSQPRLKTDLIPVDFDRIESVLGFKKSDFRPWQETIKDTVTDLLRLEKKWKENGHEINIPLTDDH